MIALKILALVAVTLLGVGAGAVIFGTWARYRAQWAELEGERKRLNPYRDRIDHE